MQRVWFAEIRISPAMEHKLRARRGAWHQHREHGRRMLVVSRTYEGRRLTVVLQPVDVADGIWRLRTAWLDSVS